MVLSLTHQVFNSFGLVLVLSKVKAPKNTPGTRKLQIDSVEFGEVFFLPPPIRPLRVWLTVNLPSMESLLIGVFFFFSLFASFAKTPLSNQPGADRS